MSDSTPPPLEVRSLKKYFNRGTNIFESLLGSGDRIKAVDDVSLVLPKNEVIGVIGESGCGKTTLLQTLMGLKDPTGGSIYFEGTDTATFSRKQWKQFRSNVQIIFQDPFNSLDPKMRVDEILKEPLKVHGMDNKNERIREALEYAELQPVDKYLKRKPTALSGGEKQRVSIARALVVEPKVLLADEPVSMLDVSTQAAILRLLEDIIDSFDMSMMYISHDLSTVSHICESINVMYLGRVVESGPTERLLRDPKHPYSQALINAIPIPDPDHGRQRTTLEGTPPDPVGVGEGCRFRDRCPERMDICETTPRIVEENDGSSVACHLYYNHADSSEHADSTPDGTAVSTGVGSDGDSA